MTTDIDLLRWQRETSTFKQLRMIVQGTDEKACMTALERDLEAFAEDDDEWTIVDSKYARREIPTNDGQAPIGVWELEATLIAHTGAVPWADSMGVSGT